MTARVARFVSISLVVFLWSLAGCQTHGRMIPPPTRCDTRTSNTLEDLQGRDKVATLVNAPDERQKIIRESVEMIDSGSPGVVVICMLKLSHSIPDELKQEMLAPLMRKCLASEDPITRWAGIYAAESLEDKELVANTLRQEYRSLLIRPEPTPWWAAAWWREEQNLFNRLNAYWVVAGLRAHLIEKIGEYRIHEAKPVLWAISHDWVERYPHLRQTARDAIRKLEGTEQR